MKMRNIFTSSFLIVVICLLSFYNIEHILALPSSNSAEIVRSRARTISRYRPRISYGRLKTEGFGNELGDEEDIFDLSKRQQTNSDDYGHLRFGKRDEQFDDYGHMRFGRNGIERK
ncbi:uncharacterized protein Dsk [Euwallacea similis]|uniref:uncharacterized protein Dsk n=1 Tax=Euwallacea similis TaxID=1736056 RepID=UPI00344C8CA3